MYRAGKSLDELVDTLVDELIEELGSCEGALSIKPLG